MNPDLFQIETVDLSDIFELLAISLCSFLTCASLVVRFLSPLSLPLLVSLVRETEMVTLCQLCGDKGYSDLLIYCSECRISALHRYCMDRVPKKNELNVHWLCEKCKICSSNVAFAHRFCIDLDENRPNHHSKNKQTNYADHSSRKARHSLTNSVDKIVLSLKKWNSIATGSKVATESDISKYKSSSFDIEDMIKNVGTSNSMETEGENGIYSPRQHSKETNPRKKRKLILVEDEQSDEEMQSNVGSSDSKYKSSSFNIEDAIKNVGSSEAEAENGMHSVTQCSKEAFPRKKRRKLILEEDDQLDEETDHFNQSVHDRRIIQVNEPLTETTSSVDAEDSAKGAYEMRIDSSSASDTQLNMPYHQASSEEAFDLPARPFFNPSWRGCFNICNEEHGPVTAHLSTRACEKVHGLVGSLPPVLRMEKLSRLDAWPNSFRKSRPTDDNIGLYFFSSDTRVGPVLDRLLDDVINNDLALKVILDEAELLVFPSVILPEDNHRFCGKYYPWGVFRRRQVLSLSIQEICISRSNELAEERYKVQRSEDIPEVETDGDESKSPSLSRNSSEVVSSSIQEICISRSNELAEERYKVQRSEDIPEVETDGNESKSPSLSRNSSDVSLSQFFKLFGTEISASCLSTESPSELKEVAKFEQSIEVHKHAGEEALAEASETEYSDYVSRKGGNATVSRGFKLFGHQFSVSSSSESLSKLEELDEEDNHESSEPEWKKEVLFHVCVLSQKKENSCKGEDGTESIVPLFVPSEDDEGGACIELFPLRVEDMAISARVSNSNDLNLKLGVCCR